MDSLIAAAPHVDSIDYQVILTLKCKNIEDLILLKR